MKSYCDTPASGTGNCAVRPVTFIDYKEDDRCLPAEKRRRRLPAPSWCWTMPCLMMLLKFGMRKNVFQNNYISTTLRYYLAIYPFYAADIFASGVFRLECKLNQICRLSNDKLEAHTWYWCFVRLSTVACLKVTFDWQLASDSPAYIPPVSSTLNSIQWLVLCYFRDKKAQLYCVVETSNWTQSMRPSRAFIL